MKSQYRRKLIDTIDDLIGDIVDDIVNRYYSDLVESDYDYERVLYTIARYIKQEVFEDKASINDIIEYLSRLRTKKSLAKLVLSYLVAKALDEREEIPAV